MNGSFTPEQRDFYIALKALDRMDRRFVEIAREILEAWQPGTVSVPENFGAPTNMREWVDVEITCRKLGTDQAAADAALAVISAVLTEAK